MNKQKQENNENLLSFNCSPASIIYRYRATYKSTSKPKKSKRNPYENKIQDPE